MITSTVGPLLLPFRASRSLDSLCFLPSAKDNAAAKSATSAKRARRAPHVVVIFRTLSCDGRLVSGVLHISRAPKLLRRAESFKCRTRPGASLISVLGVSGLTARQSIVQVGPGRST